jgi:hypothetical protein
VPLSLNVHPCSRGCRKRFASFRTMRDPKRPAVARGAHHGFDPAAFQAGVLVGGQLDKGVDIRVGQVGSRAEIPGDSLIDSWGGKQAHNQLDTPAVAPADQTRCSRLPRPDCQGRGEPRHSKGMRVVVAMPAEVRRVGGNLRGPGRRPSWVPESR